MYIGQKKKEGKRFSIVLYDETCDKLLNVTSAVETHILDASVHDTITVVIKLLFDPRLRLNFTSFASIVSRRLNFIDSLCKAAYIVECLSRC